MLDLRSIHLLDGEVLSFKVAVLHDGRLYAAQNHKLDFVILRKVDTEVCDSIIEDYCQRFH